MLDYSFHPRAEKELSRVPVRDHERIIAKIKELCLLNHPLRHPKVIKLEGRKEEDYRLRVGDYRVKFTFRKPSSLFINQVEQRQTGY